MTLAAPPGWFPGCTSCFSGDAKGSEVDHDKAVPAALSSSTKPSGGAKLGDLIRSTSALENVEEEVIGMQGTNSEGNDPNSVKSNSDEEPVVEEPVVEEPVVEEPVVEEPVVEEPVVEEPIEMNKETPEDTVGRLLKKHPGLESFRDSLRYAHEKNNSLTENELEDLLLEAYDKVMERDSNPPNNQ